MGVNLAYSFPSISQSIYQRNVQSNAGGGLDVTLWPYWHKSTIECSLQSTPQSPVVASLMHKAERTVRSSDVHALQT